MGSRSPSHSPIRDDQDQQCNEKDENNADPINKDKPVKNKQDHKCRVILISNYPSHWKCSDVKEFIIDTCNSERVTAQHLLCYFRNNTEPNAPKKLFVKMNSSKVTREVYEKLKNVTVDGKHLDPKLISYDQNQFLPERNTKPIRESKPILKIKKLKTNNDKPWNIPVNRFPEYSNNDSYGLTEEFLAHLGISRPLTKRIFIENLAPNVDEEKLREVFSLAGKIVELRLMMYPDGSSKCIAAIVYDHPVEAVQAISMFNNQWLNGNKMQVRVDHKKFLTMRVPKGLKSIGPGLGENGEALQYVRAQIEIHRMKHDIQEWFSTFDTNQSFNANNANSNIQANWNNDLLKLLSLIATPMNSASNAKFSSPGNPNVQALLQVLMQQQTGTVNAVPQNPLQNVFNALISNMGSQSRNQTLPGPINQPLMSPQPQPQVLPSVVTQQQLPSNMDSQQQIPSSTLGQQHIPPSVVNHQIPSRAYAQRSNTAINNPEKAVCSRGDSGKYSSGDYKVVFKNLPPSVRVRDLKTKMQEIGDIKWVDMIGPGKAIVSFCRDKHAEKCVYIFDKCKVDGQMIEVHYI